VNNHTTELDKPSARIVSAHTLAEQDLCEIGDAMLHSPKTRRVKQLFQRFLQDKFACRRAEGKSSMPGKI